MAGARRLIMIVAGIALIAAAVLLRVVFGASMSEAASGGTATAVWAGTIVMMLAGLYALYRGAAGRKPGGP